MATSDRKLASFSRGSDVDYSLVCVPCHRDDTTRPAYFYCKDCQEHLCHECCKHHKKATTSRHHELQDQDTMPSTQQLTDTTVDAGAADNLSTPCPRHNTEMIKLYCHDHKLVLCSICVALDHTKPCHVAYIPDISNKIVNSEDYTHIMARIDELLRKCTTLKTDTSTDAKTSIDSLKHALHEIKKYRLEINTRIDELQQEIESKIHALQQQNVEQIKSVETICEDIMKKMNMTHDSIQQLKASKQSNQLFVEVKQVQKQLHEYEQSIKSLSASAEGSIDEYKFIPSQAINDVLQTENMLGDISTKHQTRSDTSSQHNPLPASSDDTITPTYLGEIYVKTSEDRNRCMVLGMTMLPPDKLVLVDAGNNSIKLVDANSKSIISQLSLGTQDVDKPYSSTSTTNTLVAVTVPKRHHIQFISVSDKLSKTRTIQTDGYCTGIYCHQEKLIVTYIKPGKLEILDMTGRVITRVTTDFTGTDIFNQPLLVQANKNSIYVIETKPNIVIMLNWPGEITGRITEMDSVTMLTPLRNGCLLVCGGENGVVYQVAGDGTNSRIVLQDLRHPYVVGLYVDEGGHKLYISRFTEEDKHDNNILIYNI